MVQPDQASEPPSGELKPGQGIHRDGIWVDESSHIEDNVIGIATLQQHADTLAQPWDAGAGDGTADNHDDRARPVGGSQDKQRRRRRLLRSGQPRVSFRCLPQERPIGRPELIEREQWRS